MSSRLFYFVQSWSYIFLFSVPQFDAATQVVESRKILKGHVSRHEKQQLHLRCGDSRPCAYFGHTTSSQRRREVTLLRTAAVKALQQALSELRMIIYEEVLGGLRLHIFVKSANWLLFDAKYHPRASLRSTMTAREQIARGTQGAIRWIARM